MPCFEYHCPVCKQDYIRLVRWNEADDQICQCGVHLKRLASAPNFTIGGFNAKNGYSKKD